MNTKRIFLKIPSQLRDDLKILAKEKGFTMVGLINYFVKVEKREQHHVKS
jgi:hypothetical protein